MPCNIRFCIRASAPCGTRFWSEATTVRRSRLEVGGEEAGKHAEQTDTKVMRERELKLPKALKDMLSSLRRRTNERATDTLTLIGVRQYGLKMTLLLMDMPSDYVCRVT